MEGAMSLIHGPLRPIPHRPTPPSLDPLFYPLPHPALPMDLRLPWKAPPPLLAGGGLDKLHSAVLSPLPAGLPHPLDIFQQLRHHHSVLNAAAAAATASASERLPPADVVFPKSASLPLPLTSPLPALPAPTAASMHTMLPLPAGVGSARGVVEERVGSGGGGGGGGGIGGGAGGASGPAGAAVPPPPPPGMPPLILAEASASSPGTSPYGRKLFPCPQCRYTTDRRNNLKRHMLTMHQLSAKMLECCGVLFRTKAALREHALIFHYHGYTCFYCGRRFCRKALLKRHLSVHNGQKEFICNVCDYATSHKSNLERHRRVHVRQDVEGEMEGEMEGEGDPTSSPPSSSSYRRRHDSAEPLSGDDVKSNVSETNSTVDVSCDELSVCSADEEEDEDEEINVHSD